MTVRELHVIGVDPGETTAWARLTVDRRMIYGDMDPEILEWEADELVGTENFQVRTICRLARSTQGLSYQVGVAVVAEDFDVPPQAPTTDAEVLLSPVRIVAKLKYAEFRGDLGDSRVLTQPRSMAKSTATDERLKIWGLYTAGSDHIRDATRQAIVALRRAKTNYEWREKMWYCPPGENNGN